MWTGIGDVLSEAVPALPLIPGPPQITQIMRNAVWKQWDFRPTGEVA